jgi:uncharacterized protein (TIGR02452 family)
MSKILVDEFKQTRNFTKNIDKQETIVYTENILKRLPESGNQTDKDIVVKQTDTVSEILDYSTDIKVAALNFADGYEPGGLVLKGATTQEESICRSSNLYESLILDICKQEYYKYNKDNFGNGKSSDRIIYTKNVYVFRGSNLRWLNADECRFCDIITCPSPVVWTATEEEIMNRMLNIIKVADNNKVDVLILGCWGCGAFGQSWSKFNEMWNTVIRDHKHNCKIVFAIMKSEYDRNKYFNE